MGHHQYTEKPSKVYASISKGQNLEARESLEFHRAETALLVCPRILRDKGMGQIDLARLENKNILRVREVKSRPEFYGKRQRKRLKESVKFLSILFRAHGLLESSSVCKDC